MFKPMLFNTEMVRAILDGRKTQTRRIIKTADGVPLSEHSDTAARRFISMSNAVCKAPCETGDILWVREMWRKDVGRYMYNASYTDGEKFYRNGIEVRLKWRPSIHMPKEAARIFLRVKDVRVEHLDDMRLADFLKEGVRLTCQEEGNLALAGLRARERFAEVWDGTIKPADLPKYRWDANPWVWVIEFERIEKPEGWPKA